MNGQEMHGALAQHGVTHLHHANTVATSCTFLRSSRLASRGWVDYYRLPQTPQLSDDLDKQFGIWNDVFMDGVDIHRRGRTRNFYGPRTLRVSIGYPASSPGGDRGVRHEEEPVELD